MLNLLSNRIKTRGAKSLLNELQHNMVFLALFFLSLYFFLYQQTLIDLCLHHNPDGYVHAVGIYIEIKNNPVLI